MPMSDFNESVALFDLSAAEKEKLNDLVKDVVRTQRERLDAQNEYVWWADAVLFMRDVKSNCEMLNRIGYPEIAEILAEIVGKTASAMLKHAMVGLSKEEMENKEKELLDKLAHEVEILNAVVEKELRKMFLGTRGTQ